MRLTLTYVLPHEDGNIYVAVDPRSGEIWKLTSEPLVSPRPLGPVDVERVSSHVVNDRYGYSYRLEPVVSLTLTTGEVIHLLTEVGEGCFGAVYLGISSVDGRKYAIKVMRTADTTQFRLARRLNKSRAEVVEAELASYLRVADTCPYVGDIIDAIRPDPGSLAVVMPFYPKTLMDVLEHGPVDPRRAVRYTCQLAEAVECLQRMHITHRDLKPDNIAIDDMDNIHIIDFGLAVDCRNWPRDRVGTMIYMAPEVAARQETICEADVWTVGALMFELLTGTALADRIDDDGMSDDGFLEEMHRAAPALALAEILDPTLARIAASALAPTNRISARDLAADLHNIERTL